MQSFYSVSTFTPSVFNDNCKHLLLFARTDKMADMGRRCPTIVLSFWSDSRKEYVNL